MTDATKLADYIQNRTGGKKVEMGLVLGSGLSGLVDLIEDATIIPYEDLMGFPHAGVSGHSPNLVIGTLEGVHVAVFGGRAHYYENGKPDTMRVPLETLKALGASTVCLTNSSGSLVEAMGPGAQMLITDHINISGNNPLIGEQGDARFVDMVDAYDPKLCAIARAGAQQAGLTLHEGVYAWFSGPNFETPAEVRMAGILGADAVGMSTVPEVILARFLELRVVGFSNVTNMGAGMSATAITHAQTKEVAARAAQDFQALIRGFLQQYGS
ncbi:MAG TPA: purine-nucleoside phosphorylase [Hellea balneolensis]|uniref:Purine nucleoside phosphorylase n=1 Tax=Hellea balneolensis TaxID=287478 RepID=A0A7C3G598_9PROT|nr:purine-nucleoside phosphorylase [Hellea balneolensis]